MRLYKISAIVCFSLLSACSAGSSVLEGNENAVTVRSYGGNFGDHGRKLASEHCSKYNKIAVPEGANGVYIAGAFTYLCK